jgi:hypothetical protein
MGEYKEGEFFFFKGGTRRKGNFEIRFGLNSGSSLY